jgi:DNA-binding GntR family transcriptional regulator
MDGVDLSDPRAGYRRVADGIRSQIEAGELAPGDQLPTQRELAEDYGVGRETVKRALEQLRAARLVVSHQGKGSFVGQGGDPASADESTQSDFVGEIAELRAELDDVKRRLAALESERGER